MAWNSISQPSKILDHLYLSGSRAVTEKNIEKLSITCVLNLTMDVPILNLKDVEAKKLPCNDLPSQDLSRYFEECSEKIQEIGRKGGKTLVHCVAGVSRSASICIAYLIKYNSMSLREAYFFVKEKRCTIRPNIGFFKQLIQYEKKIRGHKNQSVKLVNTQVGLTPDVYAQEIKGKGFTFII